MRLIRGEKHEEIKSRTWKIEKDREVKNTCQWVRGEEKEVGQKIIGKERITTNEAIYE